MTYWIEDRDAPDGRGIVPVLCVALDEMSEEAKAIVGLDFNPSGDPDIQMSKALCVGPVEFGLRARADRERPMSARAAAVGVTELEKAQMMLTKSMAHRMKGR